MLYIRNLLKSFENQNNIQKQTTPLMGDGEMGRLETVAVQTGLKLKILLPQPPTG